MQAPADITAPASQTKCAIDAQGSFVLENRYLKASILPAQSYGVSILDKSSGKVVVEAGNVLQWRQDGGNIYRYGFEEGCGFDKYEIRIESVSVNVIEKGPLRSIARVEMVISASSPTPIDAQAYVLEYRLDAHEPFLRINVTGAAAGVSSVLSGVRFIDTIASLDHGTPYHWDSKVPAPFGKQTDFLVTVRSIPILPIIFIVVDGGSSRFCHPTRCIWQCSWGCISFCLTLLGGPE